MNRIIRINSQQSGNFTDTNNIVTFNLPPNTFDFSASYLELNTIIDGAVQTAADAGGGTPIYNPQLKWYGTDQTVNNISFVRRAQLSTTKHGVLEDTRRTDILQKNLVNYTHSNEEIDSFSYKNATQAKDYNATRGSMWREFTQNGSVLSRRRQAPINIPMSQLCRLGMSNVFPLDKTMGGVLEIELQAGTGATGWSVSSDILLPPVNAVIGTANPNAMNNVPDPGAAGAAIGLVGHPLIPTLTYGAWDTTNFPFWVGMNCKVEAASGTLLAGAANAIITDINIADDGGVELFFDQSLAALADTETLTGITITPIVPATEPTLQIVSANLVLKQLLNPPVVASSMTYTTFDTEEFSQSGSTQLNHTFRLPASCVNAILMLPEANGISKLNALNNYRLSIDNIPIVNRAIDVAGGVRNQLHFDLLMRSFQKGNLSLKNTTGAMRAQSGLLDLQRRGQNTTGREEECIIIGAPCYQSNDSKLLQVNMNATGETIVNLTVFKQLVRTIEF